MLHCLAAAGIPGGHAVLRTMFEARKRVFIDLLGWDVPVLAGRYEVDQFDDAHAVYLVLTDADGRHRASARLLPTLRPHILDTLFPSLCDEPIPRGTATLEITRFCLERRSTAGERRQARDELVRGLVAYALANGVERYTGVADLPWLQQILGFGWRARRLGRPKPVKGAMLGALLIEIDGQTDALLDHGGLSAPNPAPAAVRTCDHVH